MLEATEYVPATEKRGGLIRAVQTPLGFFALAMLVLETVLGGLLYSGMLDHSPKSQLALAVGIAASLILLIVAVSVIALVRPEALGTSDVVDLDASEKEAAFVKKAVSGNWKWTVTEIGAAGRAHFRETGKNLAISGDYVLDDNKNGHWNARHIIITNNKLIYIFRSGINGPLGFTDLDLIWDDKKEKVVRMNGGWGVVGMVSSGNIVFERLA
jgi:hypothetical protein